MEFTSPRRGKASLLAAVRAKPGIWCNDLLGVFSLSTSSPLSPRSRTGQPGHLKRIEGYPAQAGGLYQRMLCSPSIQDSGSTALMALAV